ncbi:unnamed protein product, partial [Didymodactylos carnosus]
MISGVDIKQHHMVRPAVTTNAELPEEQQLMSKNLKNETKRKIYDGVYSSRGWLRVRK